MKLPVTLLLALSIGSSSGAVGGELYDVAMPDTLRLGDETLVLNGMGLRKKAFIKVYVAGLYLPEKATDAAVILAADTPRRTEMVFKFGVGADKMCDAWREGLANNTPDAAGELVAQFDTLCSYMEDLGKGDRLTVTYSPARGTEIEINGIAKGTLAGKDFADALFACWIGPQPPSEDFKAGLLGL